MKNQRTRRIEYLAHKKQENQRSRDYYQFHKEQIKEDVKNYKQTHKEKVRKWSKKSNERLKVKREAHDLCATQMQVRLGVDDSLNHKEMLSYYFSNPNQIEQGFRPLAKEFGAGQGRIDILGIDAHGRLCIVEIKTKNEKIAHSGQMLKYQTALLKIFEALHYEVLIRMMLITLIRVIDYGTTSKSMANPIVALIKKDFNEMNAR